MKDETKSVAERVLGGYHLCQADGCDRSATHWGTKRCRVHAVMVTAKWCNAEELEELRLLLNDVEPLSLDEREEYERNRALRMLRQDSRLTSANEKRARDRGATDDDIAQAKADGIADAETHGF